MTNIKKQIKITKLFRKVASKLPEEKDALVEETQQLEKELQQKRNELFQIQRNSYRKKVSPPKKKEASFVRPQRCESLYGCLLPNHAKIAERIWMKFCKEKIILSNSVETLKRYLDLMTMLSGMEVQSYVANEHCCVVYYMQHRSKDMVKHGLRIDMTTDGNVISKSSLPVGFNLKAILEDFSNIMTPECLEAVRKGLVAYYSRLQQFDALKKLLNIEGEMFKSLDGTYMEITFYAQNTIENNDEEFSVTLILEYRIYDIHPKTYYFKGIDLPEGASDILAEQCKLFKKKTLKRAFKEAFLDDAGTYRLVQQLGLRREEQEARKRKKIRPSNRDYNNDDTFLPEDCSDQGEDDIEISLVR